MTNIPRKPITIRDELRYLTKEKIASESAITRSIRRLQGGQQNPSVLAGILVTIGLVPLHRYDIQMKMLNKLKKHITTGDDAKCIDHAFQLVKAVHAKREKATTPAQSQVHGHYQPAAA